MSAVREAPVVRARPSAARLALLLLLAAAAGAAAARAPGFALGAAALAALAAATLAWPELATVLLVFAVWLNLPALAVDRFGAPLLLGALFPFVLVIPLVHGRLRGERLVMTPTFVLLLLLFAVELLSTAGAAHQAVAVKHLRELALEGVILYLLVVNAVRTPQVLRLAIWGLIAAGACLALVSVHQQLTGSYYHPYFGLGQVDVSWFRGQSDVARLAGPLGDPNYYAQILIVVVPLGLLSIWRERAPLLRLAAAGATALVCTAIAFTYSRGAAVAFAAVLLGMVCLRYLRGRHLALLAVGVAVLLALVPGYRKRVETITTIGGATAQAGVQTSADESTRSRTTEMLAAALAFLDHPVLGVGPAGFPLYYQEYAPRVGIQVREKTRTGPRAGQAPQREAHNMVLGIAADLGLTGASVFLSIFALTARNLVRARRRWLGRRQDLVNLADSLLLALLAYFAAGLFLSLGFERYLWLLAALAGAAGASALGSDAARTNAATRSS